IWMGTAARVNQSRQIASSRYMWRFSPLGHLMDSVEVSGLAVESFTSSAFSPAGDLYLSGYYGVHRVVGSALQLVIPRDSENFDALAFDRDGYLYAVKGRDSWNRRVALYDPGFRLVNDT